MNRPRIDIHGNAFTFTENMQDFLHVAHYENGAIEIELRDNFTQQSKSIVLSKKEVNTLMQFLNDSDNNNE